MKSVYAAFFAVVLSMLLGVVAVSAQQGTTFVVNSANDIDDGVCDAAHCSLREAINASNQTNPLNLFPNTVNFSISGTGIFTIQPVTPLPEIMKSIIIDATTQPGYVVGSPAVELNGDNVVTPILEQKTGFRLTNLPVGLKSVIRGFIINGFEYAGLSIVDSGDYLIEGNFIGTDRSGTTAVPNGYGMVVKNSSDIMIGGTTLAQRNIISGNLVDGINLIEAAFVQIFNNYIGVDFTGTQKLGNSGNGINIGTMSGALIGDYLIDRSGNIISGNLLNGITANNPNPLVRIFANHIGTDVTGTNLLGNGLDGIRIEGSAAIEIGDYDDKNIIAGNGENGIHLLGAVSAQNIISENSIFDNGKLGIDLGSDGVTPNDSGLQNYPVLTKAITSPTQGTSIIGTLHSQPNTPFILDFYANPTCDASGYGEGKTYKTSWSVTTDSNGNADFVAGLYWGLPPGQFITDVASKSNAPYSGSKNASEFSACIQTIDATHNGFTYTVNTAYDTDDGVCNAANCSLREALNRANAIVGQDTILFNIPGTGPHTITISSALHFELPQQVTGLIIDGTSQPGYTGKPLIAITGDNYYNCSLHVFGDFNVVRGIILEKDCELQIGGNDNIIQGNYFGTDLNGLTATSIQGGGLHVGGDRNIIGGTLPTERNIIVGQRGRRGFEVGGNNNLIQGNYVGVDVTGKVVLGDILSGIAIGGNNNVVGGTTPGAGNIIAGSEFNGVYVASGYGNAILGNNIFANRSRGIQLGNDLSHPILNDPGDADEGVNHYQNYPELELALKNGSTISVKGTLNSTPDTTFRLEFFANRLCDLRGYGEGEQYLGFTNVVTEADGNVAFEAVLPVNINVPDWYSVTATATDSGNNTSEFSACTMLVSPDTAPTLNFYRTRFVPLSWTGVSWAAYYSIQVDTDPGFTNEAYFNSYYASYWLNVNGRNLTLSLPNTDNVYYWRVAAISADGLNRQWSSVQSFRVDLP